MRATEDALRGVAERHRRAAGVPFCDWSMFMSRAIDQLAWSESLSLHDEMMGRMGELSAQLVLSSRPIERQRRRMNQAFCWSRQTGYAGAHCKFYLPDEPDGWEATWFAQGDQAFAPITAAKVKIGFQICTELLFSDISRLIGQQGADLIAAPRATSGHRRWPMAASMAAVMSGCFVASANRRSEDLGPFPGGSWLISPEELLAMTTCDAPQVTVSVDFADPVAAKRTYPRSLYVNQASPA